MKSIRPAFPKARFEGLVAERFRLRTRLCTHPRFHSKSTSPKSRGAIKVPSNLHFLHAPLKLLFLIAGTSHADKPALFPFFSRLGYWVSRNHGSAYTARSVQSGQTKYRIAKHQVLRKSHCSKRPKATPQNKSLPPQTNKKCEQVNNTILPFVFVVKKKHVSWSNGEQQDQIERV